PGAIDRRAVEVHPAAAAGDGRAGLLVQALDIRQADERGVLGLDGLVRRADFQSGTRHARLRFDQVRVAIAAVLASVVARLDFDQAHIQPRVLVTSESQRAGDVDRADYLV